MPERPADPIALARDNWVRAGWGEAADGMAAVTSIMRVQQILLARIEGVLRPFGVSFGRFELLRLLGFTHDGRMPMSRARTLLQVHPASVSGVVDRLEADGLVRRAAHPVDGRSVLLEITPEGRDVADRATAALNAEVFESLGLAPHELDFLGRVLTRVRDEHGDPVGS